MEVRGNIVGNVKDGDWRTWMEKDGDVRCANRRPRDEWNG